MTKTNYDVKIAMQKTLKNVGIVLTPVIALEIINNFLQVIPEEYKVLAQVFVSAVAYMVKNASENGAWK